jgi:hypothetical protein
VKIGIGGRESGGDQNLSLDGKGERDIYCTVEVSEEIGRIIHLSTSEKCKGAP